MRLQIAEEAEIGHPAQLTSGAAPSAPPSPTPRHTVPSPALVVLAALGLLAAGALLLRGAMPMPPGRVAWLGAGGSIRLDDGWADVRATEDTPRGEVFLVERPLAGDPYRGGARVGVFPRSDLLACDAGARVGLGVGILAVTLTPLLLRMAAG